MFRRMRDLTAAILGLQLTTQRLVTLWTRDLAAREEGASLRDRLEALELSRETWEAGVEAEYMRADSRAKTARNAEERQRWKDERYGEAFGEGPENGETGPEGFLSAGDAPSGAAEEVLPLREVVEVDPAAARLRLKFGL